MPILTPAPAALIPPASIPQSEIRNPQFQLSPTQLSAISLLVAGDTTVLAAAKLKIDRTTLFRWRTSNPLFRAELNRRLADARDYTAAQARRLLRISLAQVEYRILNAKFTEDRTAAAFQALRHFNLASLFDEYKDAPQSPALALDELIRQDWSARGSIDPSRQITDDDRHEFLQQLHAQGAFEDATPTETHPRLRYGQPYPTPDQPDATTPPPPAPDAAPVT